MKKLVLVTISVCFIVLLLGGCGNNIETTKSTEDTQEKSTKTLEPTLIREWSGSSTKSTESFTISGNQWAISWTFTPKPSSYANYFSITVYKAGSSLPTSLVANIANISSGTSEVSYIHESGTFYLDVSSLDGGWQIAVYDYQ